MLNVPGGAPSFNGVSQADVMAAAGGWGIRFHHAQRIQALTGWRLTDCAMRRRRDRDDDAACPIDRHARRRDGREANKPSAISYDTENSRPDPVDQDTTCSRRV